MPFFFIDLILLANLLWRVIHNFLSSFSLNNTDSKLVNAYSGTNCTIKYPINAHPVFKFSTMWHYYTLLFVIILILPHTHTQMRMLNEAVFCTIKDNHNTQISTRFQNEPRHPITQTNRKYIRLLQTLAWELPPSAEREREEGGGGGVARIFTASQKWGDNKTHHNRAFITMKWKGGCRIFRREGSRTEWARYYQ